MLHTNGHESRQRAEAGNTLIIALLVLFLLTSLGVSYIAVTRGDKQVAGNQLVGSQAFANAEAGISEALLRMSNPNDTGIGGSFIGQQPGLYTAGWGTNILKHPGNFGTDSPVKRTPTGGPE